MFRWAFLFLFLFSNPALAKSLEIYFSPSRGCENGIIEKINKAENRVDAVVYAINNNRIVYALKRAHKRGVKIRILTDRLQASQKSSRVKELKEYGINIRVHSKFKIEHNKFAIIDKKIVSTGSFNWTNPASDKNSENCLIDSNNKTMARDYQKRFNYLWQVNTKKKSDTWFEKHS